MLRRVTRAIPRASVTLTRQTIRTFHATPLMPSANPIFRLDTPTNDEIQQQFAAQVQQVQTWFDSPRFKNVKRPYDAALVASKRGTQPVSPLHPSNISAQKLWATFERASSVAEPVLTMGAIDPVQMTQMAPHLEVLYVSGWASSSVLTTGNNEVGPDLADYPYTTVPNQVQRLRKAQEVHDRKMWDERLTSGPSAPWVDYLRPIVADGDTGHGGLSSVMKLAKVFGEAGVSAVHFEDQLHGGKKCGHQAGKVLVPTSEHINRLVSARLQWDIMGLETLLIARTDSESGKLISSTADARDHEFILGVAANSLSEPSLSDQLSTAERQGASASQLNAIEEEYSGKHKLVTFNEAVRDALKDEDKYAAYLAKIDGNSSNAEARLAAREIAGRDIEWSWELPRTREGYYHFQAGTAPALKRVLAFADYADLLWLETKTPDVEQALGFASTIREKNPGKWLVYNLSPSFNWAAHGYTEEQLKSFCWDLGKAGFVLQLISLAGLHSTGLITHQLARSFKDEGMLAYVNLIQKQEKATGCDVLTHQKWSGASYIDRIISAVTAGSSATQASGKDSTENSF